MDIVDQINSALKHVTGVIELTQDGDPAAAIVRLKSDLIALREELLATKEAALAANEESFDLKQRLRQMETFQADAERYSARTLESGSVVYVDKEVADVDGQPVHYLCAPCFEGGKRSYLQPTDHQMGHDIFSCNECGYAAEVKNDVKPRKRIPRPPSDYWG